MAVDAKSMDDAREPFVQARAWLVRLKSGAATRDDLAAFGAWRRASTVNEQAYRETLQGWQLLGHALAAAPAAAMPVPGTAVMAGLTRRRMLMGAGLAAGAAIVLPLSLPLTPAGATVIETRKGERRRTVLPDGVVVELNTNTRVVSWTEGDQRTVRLDRGEALLAVDAPQGQRLCALAGETQVVADHARFLLRWTDGEDPRVLCVQGSVMVRADGRVVWLGANEQIMGAAPTVRTDMDGVADALEWRKGVLVFDGRRADEVVAELNRYRDGKVYLTGPHGATRISGVIHLGRADAAVDHIARSLGLRVLRLPGGIVLLQS